MTADKFRTKRHLSPVAFALLLHQRQVFRETFGREPTNADPVWFCRHDTSRPRRMCAQCDVEMAEAMAALQATLPGAADRTFDA